MRNPLHREQAQAGVPNPANLETLDQITDLLLNLEVGDMGSHSTLAGRYEIAGSVTQSLEPFGKTLSVTEWRRGRMRTQAEIAVTVGNYQISDSAVITGRRTDFQRGEAVNEASWAPNANSEPGQTFEPKDMVRLLQKIIAKQQRYKNKSAEPCLIGQPH